MADFQGLLLGLEEAQSEGGIRVSFEFEEEATEPVA
jgi:hypothetical protein